MPLKSSQAIEREREEKKHKHRDINCMYVYGLGSPKKYTDFSYFRSLDSFVFQTVANTFIINVF